MDLQNKTLQSKLPDGRTRLSAIPASAVNPTRLSAISTNSKPRTIEKDISEMYLKNKPDVGSIARIEEYIEKTVDNPYASRYRTYPNLIEIYIPELSQGIKKDLLQATPAKLTSTHSRNKPPTPFTLKALPHFVPFVLDLDHANRNNLII
jgi:hypothetical protein